MVGRMSGQGGTSGALAVLPIVFPSPIFEKILIANIDCIGYVAQQALSYFLGGRELAAMFPSCR